MNYGDRVREARKKRGYTLRKLEKLSGVHAATISHAERGRHSTSLDVAHLLADALDVSLDWLAGRTADPLAHKRQRTE